MSSSLAFSKCWNYILTSHHLYITTLSQYLSDWDALVDMRNKLNATSTQLSDWNQNQVTPCTWNSVICDTNNNVVQVTLANIGFSGILSPRIGELMHLTVLSFNSPKPPCTSSNFIHVGRTIPDMLILGLSTPISMEKNEEGCILSSIFFCS
ncbi:hypothetical protein M5K25_017913 [Dendrobium thyrsiflorum]|uniref:Leucine-rich repeat-containing N-terminal plant-type domain-containing protein n=1 Tax=Dendrobium thyrsiflorum TaxID=117978 RepID=A0ABD0UGU3_DENTH